MGLLRVLDSASDDVYEVLRRRNVHRDSGLEVLVAGIIEDVRQRGDAALLENARKFDAPDLTSLLVTAEELDGAALEPRLYEHLRTALHRVRYFHLNQLEVILQGWYGDGIDHILDTLELKLPRRPLVASWAISDRPSGVPNLLPRGRKFGLGQRLRSLESAGVYVPGGNAMYPSSVIMNVTPAAVAMVSSITVTTPARKDGTLHPAVLVALRDSGANTAVKIGGAAAIAALALGTESVARVDKIVGPGNRFVNEAKRHLWGSVGVDGYAVPSEVCVVADESTDARFAVADLITQIEHAPDNAGYLVVVGQEKLDEILAELDVQVSAAERAETIRVSLDEQSLAILVSDLSEAADVVNAIAPEHLSLSVANAEWLLPRISNAGCILLGEYTPESAGDYVLGPSHTLPTGGAARWQSPVSVAEFLKISSVVKTSREEIQELIPVIEALAAVEGFPGHGFGAAVRRD